MKKKMNCDNCGAPLHGCKCDYCGTEYKFDDCGTEYKFDDWANNCLKIKMVKTQGKIETLGANVIMPKDIAFNNEPEAILKHYIKPKLAEAFADKILDYAEWETWYEPGSLDQLFGARVRVVMPEEGAAHYF